MEFASEIPDVLENKENKNYRFNAGDLGDALTYIVSHIEGCEYILEYVHYYAPSANILHRRTLLSIVKDGYQDLYFVYNHYCPWMIDKVSHPITCVDDWYLDYDEDYYRVQDPYRKRKGDFQREFKDDIKRAIKVNPFPYLDSFVESLASMQNDHSLTKEEIMEQAMLFVEKELTKEDVAVLKKKI